MPVFNLTDYNTPAKPLVEDLDKQTEENNADVRTLTIRSSDTVSQIVADALYKTYDKSKVEETDSKDKAETEVVSTEDVNTDPALTWERIKSAKNVVIVNKGFHTAKEEWFLDTLQNSGKKVYYSVESYLNVVTKG